MPDNILPAVPAVEMVGVTESFEDTQALDASPSEEANEGVTYVTAQDLAALEAKLLQQVERTAQSFADKTASRLDKRVKAEMENLNRAIDTMKNSGIPMTDEQVKAARQSVLDKVLLENDPDPSESPVPTSPPLSGKGNGPEPAVQDMSVAFVQSAMQKLNAQHGLALNPDDPEAEGMEKVTDPFEFVRLYQDGISRKAQRVAIPPQARVASAVTGAVKPATTLESLTAELEGLISNPRLEDLPRIQELQRELSKVRGK